jgi:hypothetical protein
MMNRMETVMSTRKTLTSMLMMNLSQMMSQIRRRTRVGEVLEPKLEPEPRSQLKKTKNGK